LKRYEVESLLKTFLIFFILLEILLAINFLQEYRTKLHQLEENIKVDMKLCAYTMQCEGLYTDFVDNDKKLEENILYKDKNFYSYYKIPKTPKYLMKVTYPHKKYRYLVKQVKLGVINRFLLYSFFAFIVTLMFAFYALKPLRQAILLNEEFVKDILHDFNTPISSMRINFKMLKKEIGSNQKIDRIENNIETILTLQNNLQIFLKGLHNQADRFDLQQVIKHRIAYFETLYRDINYSYDIQSLYVITNKDAFIRIIDNLLSNAGKYNKTNGSVKVYMHNNKLIIEDTGVGIKNPSKIFTRYYKEQDRGIGIGLHIVKKLCDELHLRIKVKSKENEGTQMILDISAIA
jgi:signal transduction histidine kinase